ncbi:MAG TPA: CAP domain-containing protein [Tepidisphaeraceae bacterium]
MPYRLESLECRRLLSAVYPTNLEQYLVELINRARADPPAEAARYGIDLNEGLVAGTISTTPKQPLAVNPFLTGGARAHSQWMIDTDTFSHTGAGGSDPQDRMTAAGYTFTAPWSWAENIAWRSFSGGSPTASLIAQLHQDLFVDRNVSDRGHRTNIMDGGLREIGTGFTSGGFQGYTAGMVTTDFATTAGNPFLTGVAYQDTVTADHFYTPGEGLAGVTITATRPLDRAVFSTTTFPSGGYSLRLPAGSYSVVASGGALANPITFGTVTIGTQNVKADFVPGQSGDVTPPTAVLTQALRDRTASRYYSFLVTYADNIALDAGTFDSYDIVVTGPNAFSRYANFNSVDSATNGTPRVVNYLIKGPGGSWDASDNGVYTITLRRRQVRDTSGNPASASVLGAFSVKIPTAAAAVAMASPVGIRVTTSVRHADDASVFA